MELVLISEGKLKVILSAEDMLHYELDCDSIDYDNTETRRAFWDILDVAKHKTGFDAAAERVFIQVYPSKAGGCELYVTKLASSAAVDSEELKNSDREEKTESKIFRRSRPRRIIYRFHDLAELEQICLILKKCDYSGESSAYSEGIGKNCYLAISFKSDPLYPELNKYSFIGEYGEKIKEANFNTYISEYCHTICEKNAVETLAGIA